ncbi:hypothetical protein ARMGADRAFT_1023160 [Armillaria gallica]|uniref:Uncharacterized protein n=1 Tax=Armillaria gallica TaxID=47427 RepID=A0A2H3E6G1_ARMGA|nr:hypothetical protein ARMGADRAFT_1023160 [Armillaria gallica]
MSKISKKPFIKYKCPTALWYLGTYGVSILFSSSCYCIGVEKRRTSSFGFLTGVIFLGLWTVLAVEDFAQDAALKRVCASPSKQAPGRRRHFGFARQPSLSTSTNSSRWTSSKRHVSRQCLVSKQKAEALYSAAWITAARESVAQDFIQISFDLVAQARRIQAIVENYFYHWQPLGRRINCKPLSSG